MLWGNSMEHMGEVKGKSWSTWGEVKGRHVGPKLSDSEVTVVFSLILQLARTQVWGPASITFPGLSSTHGPSLAGLSLIPMPQSSEDRVQHSKSQHCTAQDSSGKYKYRQIWPRPPSQLADTQNASLPLSLPPSAVLRLYRFIGRFAPSPSAVFLFKGLAWFCFFDLMLILSAALVFPRSVSHSKNSSVPIKLMGLTWCLQGL